MKIIVHEDRTLEILNQATTQNENEVENMDFVFPEKYEDWYKKVVFIINNEPKWRLIENNKYVLEKAITVNKQVQFYVWLTKEEQDFRSETKTLNFNENMEPEGEVTPEEKSEFEQLLELLEVEINKATQTEQELTDLIDNVQTKLDNGEFDGADGVDGTDGEDGISPIITETQTANGYDLSITDVNGTKTISILNGQNGKDGADGKDGAKGEKGDPGEKGETGAPGANGKDGKDGQNGVNGQDGYTPQRGTDYWNEQDIAAIEAYCDDYIDANITQAIGGAY